MSARPPCVQRLHPLHRISHAVLVGLAELPCCTLRQVNGLHQRQVHRRAQRAPVCGALVEQRGQAVYCELREDGQLKRTRLG